MMYSYITLADKTEITHFHLMEDNGVQKVAVHFKRPKAGGFVSARCVLPSCERKSNGGFSDAEIDFFLVFLHNNAHFLYRCAERCVRCENCGDDSCIPSESDEDSNPHKLHCSTCQIFLTENCETYYDCSACYECAALGGVWEPRC